MWPFVFLFHTGLNTSSSPFFPQPKSAAAYSVYDIRCLLDATVKLRDGRKITDMEMPLVGKLAMKEALKKIEGTEVEKLLKEHNVI